MCNYFVIKTIPDLFQSWFLGFIYCQDKKAEFMENCIRIIQTGWSWSFEVIENFGRKFIFPLNFKKLYPRSKSRLIKRVPLHSTLFCSIFLHKIIGWCFLRVCLWDASPDPVILFRNSTGYIFFLLIKINWVCRKVYESLTVKKIEANSKIISTSVFLAARIALLHIN